VRRLSAPVRLGIAGAVLGVALLLAAVMVGRLTGGGDADTRSGPAGTALPEAPEEQLRATPALHIHPQRAQAGPPLQLEVDGIGCPGNSGVLTITEAGSASRPDGSDRLVVRRRFEVLSDRTFRAVPTLVGQPPGTYRVSVSCERYRTAEGLDDAVRRDVFELTEVLELVGPAAAREFLVSPFEATPLTATVFDFAGRGCPGADAEVEVRVFPPSAVAPGPLAVLRPTVEGGAWSGRYSVPAAGAYGTYTFEASCWDGSGLQFSYVSRHVHFGPLVLAAEVVTSTWDDLLDDFGIRLKPATAAVEQAVPAKPSYTG